MGYLSTLRTELEASMGNLNLRAAHIGTYACPGDPDGLTTGQSEILVIETRFAMTVEGDKIALIVWGNPEGGLC